MLALLITALLGLYLYGPSLVVRLAVGLVVPPRTIAQSRGEEITVSILQAAVPLLIACFWLFWSHAFANLGGGQTLQDVFSGLYSTAFFDNHTARFYAAWSLFLRLNLALLWRLYLLLGLFAAAQDWAILQYRTLRAATAPGRARWLRDLVSKLILPRVSEWHVLLSDMLLPDGTELWADVLTHSGLLYQGKVQDKMLGNDGSLSSLTLSNPRRFDRTAYDEALSAAQMSGKTVDKASFWRQIPGNLFVILGSDIVNLNLSYRRPPQATPAVAATLTAQEIETLRKVLARVQTPAEGAGASTP